MQFKTYKFNELITDCRTGLNPRKNFKLGEGSNFYITIKDIFDGKINITEKTENINDDALKIINKRSKLKVGDILFSSIGRIADTAIIYEEPKNWNINESVFALTCNRNLIIPEFFCLMLRLPKYKDEIIRQSTGTTFASIKMNKLKEIEFDVPDLTSQLEIINDIKQLDDCLKMKYDETDKLDELIKSIFYYLFKEELKNERVKLGSLCSVITKGTTPTTVGYKFEKSGINFIKIECITEDGTFIKSKMLHISDECNNSLKRSILQENDLLFSIAGAIGRTAIVTKDVLPANTNQALAIIRLNHNSGLEVEFLNQLLKSDMIIEQCEEKQVGAAQTNMSLSDISNLEIIVPSLEKQKQFSFIIDRINQNKEFIKKETKNLEELINSKFNKYFSV